MDSYSLYRDRIGNALVMRLVKAIETEEVDTDESALIAGFLLDRLEQCKTSADVFAVTTEASEKWPFFKDVVMGPESVSPEQVPQETSVIAQQTEKMEHEAVDQASALLKENKINEALEVIEHANVASEEATQQHMQPQEQQPQQQEMSEQPPQEGATQ